MQPTREDSNKTRYVSGQKQGHYESYFLRANHPVKTAGVLDPVHHLFAQ